MLSIIFAAIANTLLRSKFIFYFLTLQTACSLGHVHPSCLSYKGGGKEVQSQGQELEESCRQIVHLRTGRQNNRKMLEKPLLVHLTTAQELSGTPPSPLHGSPGSVVSQRHAPAVQRCPGNHCLTLNYYARGFRLFKEASGNVVRNM